MPESPPVPALEERIDTSRRRELHRAVSLKDRASDAISTYFFTWPCFWVHAAWFGLWLALHIDINALTMIVSLEAIFLCILLGMSQNRQATKDRARDDHEAEEVSVLYDINKQQLEILHQQKVILDLLPTAKRGKKGEPAAALDPAFIQAVAASVGETVARTSNQSYTGRGSI